MKYHPYSTGVLTEVRHPDPGHCQAGSLTGAVASQSRNGGSRRFSQAVWKSAVECKGRRELNCKTYKSSRWETRP